MNVMTIQLPGGHSSFFAYVHKYRLVMSHTTTIFFAAHQPIWYMPTAARTTDERHRHGAKQLVQQCSNLHVNKRNESWFPKTLIGERGTGTASLGSVCTPPILGSWNVLPLDFSDPSGRKDHR